MRTRFLTLLWFVLLTIVSAANADRLSYLEPPCDPYYPHTQHPRLTTPQWVGDEGVEAVVILSIDDMRDSAKYERFLRPLLDRLKQIDGRAPVSIFANQVDPRDPQLQAWLQEGLSLETHTADHPCPLLCDGDFEKAKSTYERCVDQLFQVPNNRPVAFRMPCCDSLNTPSPRFWTEIFAKTTDSGNHLAIDSSVFNIFTKDDATIPAELVTREDGSSRFRHYVPFPSFVNTIENYPYPYVIGGVCWEFPCVVPSDWEAQHVQQPNNPMTVQDWNRALDITVLKQGVMPIVFHPHNWIRAEQLAEFVDYAQKTYGSKVKFLTFSEALERLNANLLGGTTLREQNDGLRKQGVRLVDVNVDGFIDVFQVGSRGSVTRVWNSENSAFDLYQQNIPLGQMRFGDHQDGVYFLLRDSDSLEFESYQWSGRRWKSQAVRFEGVDIDLAEADYLLRDMDHDGRSELFLSDATKSVVMRRTVKGFEKLPYEVPVSLSNRSHQRDLSVRLVDLNGDDKDDLVRASPTEQSVWLFTDHEQGWKRTGVAEPELAPHIPAFLAADGTDNGAWFHSEHVWTQNEHTAHLPDHVDRASFQSILEPSHQKSSEEDSESQDIEAPLGRAKTLEESLKTLSVVGSGRLEVVAAEPEIADPVAFDWGPGGELWVVEMGDYPNGAAWHGPGDPKGDPGGRVKLLFDQDGDGRYETAHTFLDGLGVPTGVMSFRDGVLVCVAPNIIYAEDTDGDHVADTQEILYEGLNAGNQQHRANGLRWGLDHWIHLANGDSGGRVKSRKTGQAINIRGRDFRIHPDTGQLELTSGQTQFGRSRDNAGNWFGGSNSEPVWHYVLDEKYQARNRFVVSPSARHITSRAPGAAPVYPTSKTLERFNDFDRANRFTSACSTEISRNDADEQSFVYVCEPVHNLVHRSSLTRDGVTFASDRLASESQQELLTSTDNWFRPVMVRFGPDNAIWVADMYRQVIEHPEWIPMEWQKRIDHLGGNDQGRIYRVVFEETLAHGDSWKRIDSMTIEQLVQLLDTANGIVRDMVQQELYERRDRQSVALLKDLHRRVRWPAARTAIVYLLAEFEALDESFLANAFEQGVVDAHLLQASISPLNESKELKDRFFAWLGNHLDDETQRIRAAYLLGELRDPRAATWLSRLALDYGEDVYVGAAVMSSASQDNILPLLRSIVKGLSLQHHAFAESVVLRNAISVAIGTEHAPSLKFIAHWIAELESPVRIGVLSLILDQLARHDKSAEDLFDEDDLKGLYAATMDGVPIAQDRSLSLEQRLAALSVLGVSPAPSHRARDLQALQSLLNPANPSQLQAEALKRLRQLGESKTPQRIFQQWPALVPAIRDAAIREAIVDEDWCRSLLDAIQRGDVQTREIGLHHQARLREHGNTSIREQAIQLLKPVPSDREGLVEDYRQQKSARVSLSRGKEHFGRQCASCHQLEGLGKSIGPDLTALTDRSRAAMLTAILDPNRAVEDKYLSYSIVLHSGQTYQGLLAQETATSLVLATAEGETRAILRGQMELIQSTGKSLMPEGMERILDPQAMDDVIHYVQSVRANRKQFDGNQPQVAPMRDDGSIRLFAMHAEIYGPDLVLETRYRNLGFWHSELDRAVWTIHAQQPGQYRLSLDYACPPEHAGNLFQIRVHGQKLSETVESTGSWDRYRSQGVGTLRLPAEPVRLTVTSDGPIEGYLFDLRTIILRPMP